MTDPVSGRPTEDPTPDLASAGDDAVAPSASSRRSGLSGRLTDAQPRRADTGGPGSPIGPRRVLVALYAVFALAATARGIVQISVHFDKAPLAYLLSLLAGAIYIVAAVALIRPTGFRVALLACSIELLGVLTVGLLSLFDAAAFPDDTVWSRFGSGYGYIPLVLPILGLWFLARHRPGTDGSTARA